MNKKKVLHPKYFPTWLPITDTLVYILFIKVFDIQGVGLGVFISFIVLLWLIRIYGVAREKYSHTLLMDDEDIPQLKIMTNESPIRYSDIFRKKEK